MIFFLKFATPQENLLQTRDCELPLFSRSGVSNGPIRAFHVSSYVSSGYAWAEGFYCCVHQGPENFSSGTEKLMSSEYQVEFNKIRQYKNLTAKMDFHQGRKYNRVQLYFHPWWKSRFAVKFLYRRIWYLPVTPAGGEVNVAYFPTSTVDNQMSAGVNGPTTTWL